MIFRRWFHFRADAPRRAADAEKPRLSPRFRFKGIDGKMIVAAPAGSGDVMDATPEP
jgi:hypothetical protein